MGKAGSGPALVHTEVTPGTRLPLAAPRPAGGDVRLHAFSLSQSSLPAHWSPTIAAPCTEARVRKASEGGRALTIRWSQPPWLISISRCYKTIGRSLQKIKDTLPPGMDPDSTWQLVE